METAESNLHKGFWRDGLLRSRQTPPRRSRARANGGCAPCTSRRETSSRPKGRVPPGRARRSSTAWIGLVIGHAYANEWDQ
jgi:hypothetical protein